jgi:hypothetical protein
MMEISKFLEKNQQFKMPKTSNFKKGCKLKDTQNQNFSLFGQKSSFLEPISKKKDSIEIVLSSVRPSVSCISVAIAPRELKIST